MLINVKNEIENIINEINKIFDIIVVYLFGLYVYGNLN